MKRNIPTIVLLMLFFSHLTFAADYYWVGGTGNWSDINNHWATTSGGNIFHPIVPTSADNVFFDANSFGPGDTVIVDINFANCADMDWTGVTNNPVFTYQGTFGGDLNIYGSLTLSPSMTIVASPAFRFSATTPGHTITTNGTQIPSWVYFDGIGGEWTLQDETLFDSRVYLDQGTLNTNSQTVYTGLLRDPIGASFSLTLGNSTLYVEDWSLSNNVNVNGGTATIYTDDDFSNSNSATINRVICLGSYTEIRCGGSINKLTVHSAKTFLNNNITFNDSVQFTYPGAEIEVEEGTTQTFNGELIITPGSCTKNVRIHSNEIGTQATFSKSSGQITIDYVDLLDIYASGGAIFTANNAIDQGNTTGWTMNTQTPANYYWVGGQGNWSDSSHWSLSSGGAPANCLPSLIDDVFFDVNSFASPNDTVFIDANQANCHDMDWTGVSNNPTLIGTGSQPFINIYGSLTLSANMNMAYSSEIHFVSHYTGNTIQTNGQTLLANVVFTNPNGEWTLADEFNSTANVEFNLGTFNTANYNMTFDDLSYDSFIIGSRTLDLGSSEINCNFFNLRSSGVNFNAGTSHIVTQGIVGAGLTYYDVSLINPTASVSLGSVSAGAVFNKVTINAPNCGFFGDNTFNDSLKILFPSCNIQIGTFSTQTCNGELFIEGGNCQNPTRIRSDWTPLIGTIVKTSGTVNIDHVEIHDITVTGGAIFNVTNAIDLGNNIGWTVSPRPATNYYWVGNTGNWSDGNNWSTSSGGTPVGCVPSFMDNVFFDGSSFANPDDTLFIDTEVNCADMDWSGIPASQNPTLTGISPSGLNIYGSLVFSPYLNMDYTGAPVIQFEATTPGHTITTAGIQIGTAGIGFMGIGGEWTFQDDLTFWGDPSYRIGRLQHYHGTVNTNNYNWYIGKYDAPGISGQSGRGLNLGSSTIWTAGWVMGASEDMTQNPGTSHIIINSAIDPYVWPLEMTFYGDSLLQFYDVTILDTANLVFEFDLTAFSTPLEFNKLKIDVQFVDILGSHTYNDTLGFYRPGGEVKLRQGNTQTLNGELYFNSTSSQPIELKSMQTGSQTTFYKPNGTLCFENLFIEDNEAIGGATFYAGLNSDDINNNIGWIFQTSTDCASIVTEIAEEIPIGEINTYPNPGNGIYTISLDGVEAPDVSLEVYNVLNELITTDRFFGSPSTINVDITNQPAGIYFFHVKAGEQTFTEKVVLR